MTRYRDFLPTTACERGHGCSRSSWRGRAGAGRCRGLFVRPIGYARRRPGAWSEGAGPVCRRDSAYAQPRGRRRFYFATGGLDLSVALGSTSKATGEVFDKVGCGGPQPTYLRLSYRSDAAGRSAGRLRSHAPESRWSRFATGQGRSAPISVPGQAHQRRPGHSEEPSACFWPVSWIGPRNQPSAWPISVLRTAVLRAFSEVGKPGRNSGVS